MTQISLEEKRSELLSVETQLRSMEEKYYNSTVTIQDKVTSDLRVSGHSCADPEGGTGGPDPPKNKKKYWVL